MKTNKKTQKTQKTQNVAQAATSQAAVLNLSHYTTNDLKNALLLVSVFINVFIFTAWLTLQVTDRYNAAIISFLVR